MAGTPADLTTYADNNYEHDHTYYGRGCKRDWGTSGESGSQTPCTDSDAGGRYVETADSETQKNGTYYNFQAATVGSGGVITSGDSPNTVCPLGWQLPYSGTDGDYYDKSKSWNYLFATYGIAFNDGTAVASTKVRSYPFSYVYSGDFNWYKARLYYQSLRGLHWSSTIVSGEYGGYNLITQYSVVKVIGTYGKSDGLAVRCVKFLAFPSSTARWQETTLFWLTPIDITTTPITEMAVQTNGTLIFLILMVDLM